MYKIIIVIIVLILNTEVTWAQYADTTKSIIIQNNIISPSDSVSVAAEHKKYHRIPIISEALIGFGLGSLTAIGVSGISYVIIQPTGMGGLVIVPIAYLGFILGSSTGVYYVVKQDNPNVSWGMTALFGLAGAAAGFGFWSILPDRNLAPILILPFVLEIIYADFLVPEYDAPSSFQANTGIIKVADKNKLYDLYEQTKVINLKVFSINF